MSGEPPYRVEVEYVSATRFTSPLAKLSWNDVRGHSLEGVSQDEDAPEGSTGSSKCITTIAFELAVCRMSASRETLSSTVRKLQRTGPQRGTGRSKELVRRRATSMPGPMHDTPARSCVCERLALRFTRGRPPRPPRPLLVPSDSRSPQKEKHRVTSYK